MHSGALKELRPCGVGLHCSTEARLRRHKRVRRRELSAWIAPQNYQNLVASHDVACARLMRAKLLYLALAYLAAWLRNNGTHLCGQLVSVF